MKREIKFRGYENKCDPFVYGSLSIKSMRYGLNYEIITLSDEDDKCDVSTRVHPESIGQFTGLKDKNGTKIYEGDILACPFYNKTRTKSDVLNLNIHFREGEFTFNLDKINLHKFRYFPDIDECEIIGNIHENPELIQL